ncbi:hypothetical protein J2T57_001439 [Natronocella acetinitrilica]|uniref:Uncharacterized protein n=1 Tax=Natronocella acetinitrilica TaxID=414046 RepID=A0AAE3G5P5_9GAMM|nr:hypothetical protein [Natronocella acetinitrilica]MCP1674337.1 hypothetical protein [Natronocella acetinitrilica]
MANSERTATGFLYVVPASSERGSVYAGNQCPVLHFSTVRALSRYRDGLDLTPRRDVGLLNARLELVHLEPCFSHVAADLDGAMGGTVIALARS